DLIAEMKTFGLLQKASRWDPTVAPAQELLDMVTVNGAKAIGMEKDLGSLEPGKYADLVVIDGQAPNLRPLVTENVVANLAYSLNQTNVKTVMCQGDIVVDDHVCTTLDVPSLVFDTEEIWRTLCQRP
ncbi:MAG: amidohydrolase family protein, partial [Candidatus Methanomethylophilus sp.]|nr:amidohydrolase family protein [Methanomethylophilus sp.]